MGHKNSKAVTEAVKKLSSLELENIKAVFNELSTENQEGTREIPEPNLATRKVFAERFSLPGLIGERLFHAFDRDNNGTINLEEFVGGVALCLHGSAQAKCELLFRVFNFSDDEDTVTEDELKTVLLSSLQSANTILDSVQNESVDEAQDNEKPLIKTVAEIVEDAFKTCDKSKNGKLSAKEFSTWLDKNPQIMDNMFGWQCPKPELGHWANEVEVEPLVAEQDSGKSLQHLFGGPSNQDVSGESFFDTLGTQSDTSVANGTLTDDVKEEVEIPRDTNPTDSTSHNLVMAQSDTHSEKEHESSSLNTGTTMVLPHIDVVHSTTPGDNSNVEHLKSNAEMPFFYPYDQYAALWLPTDNTNSFLQAIKNGTVKPESLTLPNFPVPCIAIDSPQVDPVKELVSKYVGDSEMAMRSIPTEDTVTCNESGLRQLLKAECWRAALNLTTKLLESDNPKTDLSQIAHVPKLLEIWFCRIALLFQLKMFSIAEGELAAFNNLDSAKLYYEYYPALYPERQGSMVPFCFRILDAMLPQHTGHPKDSLEKLLYLHSVCCQILKNLTSNKDVEPDEMQGHQNGVKLWERRLIQVLYGIGNTFISLKEYNHAISVFKLIAKKDHDNSKALMSGIGRVCLQSGDIQSAQSYFKAVEDIGAIEGSSQLDVLINRGLLALSLDAYEEAYKNFVAARNIDPENSVAANNAAVSLLFQGRLKEALALLEDIVFKHPERNLQEGILFNICTMYELETSHHMKKKQHLLGLIAKHKSDGLNVSCLKFS